MSKPLKRLDEAGMMRKVKRAINDLQDEVKRLRIANGVGYRVKRTAVGTVLSIQKSEAQEPSDLQLELLHVYEVKATYLVCRRLGSGTSFLSGDIAVYRPFETQLNAQATQYGYSPSAYTDTSGGTAETRQFTINTGTRTYTINEALSPAYGANTSAAGDGTVILAAKDVDGFDKTDDDGNPIDWIDLNINARKWLCTWSPTEVCVAGVTKYILIPRTEAVA